MDLSVDEFIAGLLTKESLEKPSDSVKLEHLDLELPKWWDEEKYNRGRKFYWKHAFGFSVNMVLGLVAVFSVPSILKVLIGSKRSSSVYTAYKRYVSTTFHVLSWFEHELKPGSVSWKSLFAVRSRHLRAGLASKLKGGDFVSQRDLALTQFGFIGFSVLKPDKFGVWQEKDGDWDDYLFLWRTIGHMIGIEDRYNLCRKTVDETRQVCQIILDRVYTPCMDNVPEYFEHMSKVMLDGTWFSNPALDSYALMYWIRYLANVPGYIYTEEDRIKLQTRLKEKLKGKPLDTGVDSRELLSSPATAVTDDLPERPPRLLFLRDYDSLHNVPEYKRLSFTSKYKLTVSAIVPTLYATCVGKFYFNGVFKISNLISRYFPYLAFIKFGIKQAFVDMFVETPHDDTEPKTNAEYYNMKPKPWYLSWLDLFW